MIIIIILYTYHHDHHKSQQNHRHCHHCCHYLFPHRKSQANTSLQHIGLQAAISVWMVVWFGFGTEPGERSICPGCPTPPMAPMGPTTRLQWKIVFFNFKTFNTQKSLILIQYFKHKSCCLLSIYFHWHIYVFFSCEHCVKHVFNHVFYFIFLWELSFWVTLLSFALAPLSSLITLRKWEKDPPLLLCMAVKVETVSEAPVLWYTSQAIRVDQCGTDRQFGTHHQ